MATLKWREAHPGYYRKYSRKYRVALRKANAHYARDYMRKWRKENAFIFGIKVQTNLLERIQCN